MLSAGWPPFPPIPLHGRSTAAPSLLSPSVAARFISPSFCPCGGTIQPVLSVAEWIGPSCAQCPRTRLSHRHLRRLHPGWSYGTERSRPLAGFFPCFPQVLRVVFHRPCNLLCILSTSPPAMQGSRCFVSPSPQTPSYSRRHTSRVETPDGVWVYCRCNGRDEVSPVPGPERGRSVDCCPKSTACGHESQARFSRPGRTNQGRGGRAVH